MFKTSLFQNDIKREDTIYVQVLEMCVYYKMNSKYIIYSLVQVHKSNVTLSTSCKNIIRIMKIL